MIDTLVHEIALSTETISLKGLSLKEGIWTLDVVGVHPLILDFNYIH